MGVNYLQPLAVVVRSVYRCCCCCFCRCLCRCFHSEATFNQLSEPLSLLILADAAATSAADSIAAVLREIRESFERMKIGQVIAELNGSIGRRIEYFNGDKLAVPAATRMGHVKISEICSLSQLQWKV